MLLAHEIGHTWFPMIVGSKKQRGARMDEDINSFVDVCGAKAFEAGEYAPNTTANTPGARAPQPSRSPPS